MATTKMNTTSRTKAAAKAEPATTDAPKAKKPLYADDDQSPDAQLWRMDQEIAAMHERQARGEPPQ